MTEYNYPEFYVWENGFETITLGENYRIVRNGEMRIIDNRPEFAGNVYRYTDRLERAGITESNLYELINSNQIEVINNPWFEVWNMPDNPNEYESDAIHELMEAESLLAELEKELTK